jgi:hypothetical protein
MIWLLGLGCFLSGAAGGAMLLLVIRSNQPPRFARLSFEGSMTRWGKLMERLR